MLSFVTSLTTSKVANDIIMSMRYLDDLATPLPRGIFLTLRIWQRWHNNMDERTYIFFFSFHPSQVHVDFIHGYRP